MICKLRFVMKRTHANAMIDLAAFIAFLLLLSTGLILEYQLTRAAVVCRGVDLDAVQVTETFLSCGA
jgi:hypothetical protein